MDKYKVEEEVKNLGTGHETGGFIVWLLFRIHWENQPGFVEGSGAIWHLSIITWVALRIELKDKTEQFSILAMTSLESWHHLLLPRWLQREQKVHEGRIKPPRASSIHSLAQNQMFDEAIAVRWAREDQTVAVKVLKLAVPDLFGKYRCQHLVSWW